MSVDPAITALCDRLDRIQRICRDMRITPGARLRMIEELSAGFMAIPPCGACGKRHAAPDCAEREP